MQKEKAYKQFNWTKDTIEKDDHASMKIANSTLSPRHINFKREKLNNEVNKIHLKNNYLNKKKLEFTEDTKDDAKKYSSKILKRYSNTSFESYENKLLKTEASKRSIDNNRYFIVNKTNIDLANLKDVNSMKKSVSKMTLPIQNYYSKNNIECQNLNESSKGLCPEFCYANEKSIRFESQNDNPQNCRFIRNLSAFEQTNHYSEFFKHRNKKNTLMNPSFDSHESLFRKQANRNSMEKTFQKNEPPQNKKQPISKIQNVDHKKNDPYKIKVIEIQDSSTSNLDIPNKSNANLLQEENFIKSNKSILPLSVASNRFLKKNHGIIFKSEKSYGVDKMDLLNIMNTIKTYLTQNDKALFAKYCRTKLKKLKKEHKLDDHMRKYLEDTCDMMSKIKTGDDKSINVTDLWGEKMYKMVLHLADIKNFIYELQINKKKILENTLEKFQNKEMQTQKRQYRHKTNNQDKIGIDKDDERILKKKIFKKFQRCDSDFDADTSSSGRSLEQSPEKLKPSVKLEKDLAINTTNFRKSFENMIDIFLDSLVADSNNVFNDDLEKYTKTYNHPVSLIGPFINYPKNFEKENLDKQTSLTQSSSEFRKKLTQNSFYSTKKSFQKTSLYDKQCSMNRTDTNFCQNKNLIDNFRKSNFFVSRNTNPENGKNKSQNNQPKKLAFDHSFTQQNFTKKSINKTFQINKPDYENNKLHANKKSLDLKEDLCKKNTFKSFTRSNNISLSPTKLKPFTINQKLRNIDQNSEIRTKMINLLRNVTYEDTSYQYLRKFRNSMVNNFDEDEFQDHKKSSDNLDFAHSNKTLGKATQKHKKRQNEMIVKLTQNQII